MPRPTSLALSALFALVLSGPAAAFDATGTWIGKQTCHGFDGAGFSFKLTESTLEIMQTGSDLALQVVSTAATDVYRGVSIDAAGSALQGQLYFVHCGTSDVPGSGVDQFDETGILAVKTKDNGSGKLKGISTYFNTAPEFANCRWSYKRTSTSAPVVPACP